MKRRRSGKKTRSWVIPAVVGIVLLATLITLAATAQNRDPGTAQGGTNNPTAGPLNTSELPYPNVPRISVDETVAGMEGGQVVLVDVRSRESYQKLHAAGAIIMPETEVQARLEELPRDKWIVLYCT